MRTAHAERSLCFLTMFLYMAMTYLRFATSSQSTQQKYSVVQLSRRKLRVRARLPSKGFERILTRGSIEAILSRRARVRSVEPSSMAMISRFL